MNDSFRCPNCERIYPLKAGLAGRRVKCARCGHVFRVSAPGTEPTPLPTDPPNRPAAGSPGGALPLADGPDDFGSDAKSLPARAKLRPVPARGTRPSKRAGAASAGDLSDREMAWMKVAGSIIVFGAVSLILPMFGLQFRKLAKAGDDAGKVGVGMIALGVLMMGFVLFRRLIALTFKYAVRAVVVLLGGVVIVMMLVRFGLIGSWRRLPPPFAACWRAGAARAGLPGPPGFRSSAGTGRRALARSTPCLGRRSRLTGATARTLACPVRSRSGRSSPAPGYGRRGRPIVPLATLRVAARPWLRVGYEHIELSRSDQRHPRAGDRPGFLDREDRFRQGLGYRPARARHYRGRR